MPKVILISIDGACWPAMNHLFKKGDLPVLSRLVDQGVSGTLNNINMLEADLWEIFDIYREYIKKIPRLGSHSDLSDWLTSMTGFLPKVHGVISSTEKDSRGREIPASRRTRKRPVAWEILANKGKTIGVIGCMGDWPPIALPHYNVSRFYNVDDIYFRKANKDADSGWKLNLDNLHSRLTYPANLAKELLKFKPDSQIESFIQRGKPYIRGALSYKLRYDSLYCQWAKYLLKRFPQPDFFALSLHEIHSLSHLFWDCLPLAKKRFKGAVHRRRQKKYGGIIEDYYRYIDKNIGEVLKLSDSDSTVMILSHYGMVDSRIFKKYIFMDKIYHKLNFFFYDDGIDWDRTSVYDNVNPWGIYAVRKGFIRGRNPQKIFLSLSRKMKKIITNKGEPLFLDISFEKQDNSFKVVPNYKAINYSTKILIKGEEIPVKELVDFKPHYSIHNPEGVFIVSSRKRQSLKVIKDKVDFLDILPTIFSFYGIKKDPKMSGEVFVDRKRR
ncbi:MAG: alkaline phosphatase family protein [Candidatus Omnitrophica bacterium]|nr:alkaline phosphatase family protein [Candidatus Omnitrophota bacterium]